MNPQPVGISILTNSQRSKLLEACIVAFLTNTHYRPLVIALFDNGSTDDTSVVFKKFAKPNDYALTWRNERTEQDYGCAHGTNRSIELVRDCPLILHLESDFICVAEDPRWLHRAVKFMEGGGCDYLYLRKFRSEAEKIHHWFPQWQDKLRETHDEFQRCENFWWSNNPALFRYETLKKSGTLPLNPALDGPKGSENWSRPEMVTPKPPNTWLLHPFGNGYFVHLG
jgi:GT2 family glycosyltransferase